ncbi:MAG: hypothetical protein RLN72_09110 [Henriciella sp.]
MGLFGAKDARPVPKGIRVKFHRADKTVRNHHMIAVLSFHGAMPDGSLGKQHGRYIAAETAYWVTWLDALAMVLDFRDLDYKWGDSMLRVFQVMNQYLRESWSEMNRPVPIKLLSSDKSIGLRSLIPNEEIFFDTMDEALRACDRDLQDWLDAD